MPETPEPHIAAVPARHETIEGINTTAILVHYPKSPIRRGWTPGQTKESTTMDSSITRAVVVVAAIQRGLIASHTRF